MNKASLLSTVSFLRRRQPNLVDMQALLDHLPRAGLLLDTNLKRILIANGRATELTAFTRAELANLNPPDLLPLLSEPSQKLLELAGNRDLTTSIAARRGASLEVLLGVESLDPQGLWLLVTFEPASSILEQQAERQREAHRWEDVYELAMAAMEDNPDRAIQITLQAGQRLTGANILAIYLFRPDNPDLIRIASLGPADLFPENFPVNEASLLLDPILWSPGKRATTSFQKAARAAKLAYLACAPLGEPGAMTGLILAASQEGSIPGNLVSPLQLLATTLTTITQHETQRSNLIAGQKSLERSLSIAQTAQDHNQDGMIVLTPQLLIESLNPAAEALLGYAAREILDQPVSYILIGAANLVPALQAAQHGIPTHNLGEARLHRRDGSAFLAHVRILPLVFEDQIAAIIVLLKDLSEHEQFQVRNQQLEQRALLGEVTAIFAHEVRNPINNISTGLQVMAMNLPPDDSNQEMIARLSQDCNRLEHLLQSVLTFSHPAENKNESLELATLVSGLVDRWKPRLVRVNVHHNLKITTKPTTVFGDPRALEQVFNNLIGNAVQAMGANGGDLNINVRQLLDAASKTQVAITVSDNGPGIPEEYRQRIFEPFFTTNQHGTGLGLAIAKRIVTAHKGTIKVDSVPGGTAFQVLLPLIEETTDPQNQP